MKRHLQNLVFVFTFFLFYAGCKTSSKLYEKGDYDEAVKLATKKLRKNADDTGQRSVLINAYRFAVNEHERKIREYSTSSSEFKWEWVYNEYTALQGLSEAIWQSPEALSLVHPADYSSYRQTYADKAGLTRYDRGIRLMEQQDRESMKQAYREFKTAQRYIPGDMNLERKIREAYELAVINVIVQPFQEPGYRFSSYTDHQTHSFEDNLVRNLRSYGADMFVKFYTEWEARNKNIRPDQFIVLRFREINIGRPRDIKKVREVSKDVVVKETVYPPDSVVKEYKKVFAKITTTKRTVISDGNIYVDIRDGDGLRLWNDRFDGHHRWETEFHTYTGDDQALSESDKALINRKGDRQPHNEEIMRKIMEEITGSMYSRIRDYYRKF